MFAVRKLRTIPMTLKPQDIVVILKLVTLRGQPWTVRSLAPSVFISHSEIFEGLKRLKTARMVAPDDHTPRRRALEELLVHGVKYVFPPERGGLTRGMPTGSAAPPLCGLLSATAEPPVWPHPLGTMRGFAFSPLYKTVPEAAACDGALYELLALVDAIRDGQARETALAVRELQRRLQGEEGIS